MLPDLVIFVRSLCSEQAAEFTVVASVPREMEIRDFVKIVRFSDGHFLQCGMHFLAYAVEPVYF